MRRHLDLEMRVKGDAVHLRIETEVSIIEREIDRGNLYLKTEEIVTNALRGLVARVEGDRKKNGPKVN